MQLSREQVMGGPAFLEFLWKSLGRMIWHEGHVEQENMRTMPEDEGQPELYRRE